MSTPYYDCEFPIEGLGVVNIMAQHFCNEVLLTIRLDGMMNYTLEVNRQGIRPLEQDTPFRPIAGINDTPKVAVGTQMEQEEEEELFIRDNLADSNVVVKLGDPNDNKLIVISTQIAELYHRVILPQLERQMPVGNGVSTPNLIITLHSRIWDTPVDHNDNNNSDFNKLVLILRSIKQMYN